MKLRVFLLFFVLLSLNVKGERIIGNLNTGDDLLRERVGVEFGLLYQRAIAFRTPDYEIEIEDVILRLENSLSGGVPVVTLNADNGMTSAPGAIQFTFNNPTLSDPVGDFTFLAPSTFTLQPNTVYWIVVDHLDNSSLFQWVSSSSNNPNTSTGIAVQVGNLFSLDDGTVYSGTGPTPSYQVNGTVIRKPIPSLSQWGMIVLMLMMMCTGVVVLKLKRKSLLQITAD